MYQSILCGAACLAALVGCGAPDPQFAYQPQTDELVDEVGEAVKAEVVDKFGTPNHPVAWLRMPVDFGVLTGTVAGLANDEGEEGTYRLKVELEGGENAPAPEGINFQGLGLLWKSGAYADGAQVDGGPLDGGQLYAIDVAGFDPQTSVLLLRQRMNPPPAAGDTFEIVGHKLAAGRQLYAAHCQHCHGVSGDGDGPTAKYLDPRPRDYRLGKFKFKATNRSARPNDDDLARIVSKGIPGTYMPSFLLLEEGELDAIVEYVKWLAMRGEYELALVNSMSSDFGQEVFDERLQSALENYDPQSGAPKPSARDLRRQFLEDPNRDFVHLAEVADTEAQFLASRWQEAAQPATVVSPPIARSADTHESRATGRVLFIKNCASCHGATGRGDGEQAEAYMVNAETRERYPEPGLFDDWGEPISPRDLTRGIYRGGRRPVDLYRRIHEGINGTPMISFKGKFSPEDPQVDSARIWDIVNYVYSIPFGGVEEPETTSPERTAAAR